VTERQRTLKGAIEWSYRLLAPELQRFFAACPCSGRLDRRGGGSRLRGAAALDYLAQLRENSLVLSEEGEQGMRFSMLETLREFGGEQLTADEQAHAERRHLEFFLLLAEAPERVDAAPVNFFDRWDMEHNNLRVALLWCKAQDSRTLLGLRLMEALHWFWINRGHWIEARQHLAELLSREAAAQPTWERAAALDLAASLAFRQGDNVSARPLLEEALALWRGLDDKERIAVSLNRLGTIASDAGDSLGARALYEESVAMAKQAGKRGAMAPPLCNLGSLAFDKGDYAAARAYWEETLKIDKEGISPLGGPHLLRCLALLAARRGTTQQRKPCSRIA
jgi:tetratricopeptide (TPR) repeat protein